MYDISKCQYIGSTALKWLITTLIENAIGRNYFLLIDVKDTMIPQEVSLTQRLLIVQIIYLLIPKIYIIFLY